MGRAEPAPPVKFFVGFIAADPDLIEKARNILAKKFGDVGLESDVWSFDFTTYYNNELGQNLKRKFITFDRLITIENIKSTKILTNRLEKKLSTNGKRTINIDPGYLCLGKVALLTTKDYSHRIYIGKGIYAETTLYYKDRSFQPFEWTYPDYRTEAYIDFFNKAREYYRAQLKKSDA